MSRDRIEGQLRVEGYVLDHTLHATFGDGDKPGRVSVYRRAAPVSKPRPGSHAVIRALRLAAESTKVEGSRVLVVEQRRGSPPEVFTEGGPWALVAPDALGHHVEIRAAELVAEHVEGPMPGARSGGFRTLQEAQRDTKDPSKPQIDLDRFVVALEQNRRPGEPPGGPNLSAETLVRALLLRIATGTTTVRDSIALGAVFGVAP